MVCTPSKHDTEKANPFTNAREGHTMATSNNTVGDRCIRNFTAISVLITFNIHEFANRLCFVTRDMGYCLLI